MRQNPGAPLDMEWIAAMRLDDGTIAARAAACSGAWAGAATTAIERHALATAIRCLDLTSLRAENPLEEVHALCEQARDPLGGMSATHAPDDLHVAAVCVFPEAVAAAVHALDHTEVSVAAACGFPDGRRPAPGILAEIRRAVAAGAREIDAVLDRDLIAGERWKELYDRVRRFREAAGDGVLKVILRSGVLPSGQHVARAGLTCAMAGADFLKTSTGRDRVNATLEAVGEHLYGRDSG